MENAYTTDQTSWGYNRRATYEKYLTVTSLVHTLVEVVAFHGNLLLRNVGPRADGTIDPIFVDRLSGMGDWLRVNGEAMYSSRPWKAGRFARTKLRRPSIIRVDRIPCMQS
jgi:alpha-L-fucosidase